MSVFSDAIGDYQDEVECWARRTWTLPPYKSKAFDDALVREGLTLAEVQNTVMYVHALQVGMIIGDEWTGVELADGRWHPEVTFDKQLRWILNRTIAELQALKESIEDEAGRTLFVSELGELILRYFEVEADGIFDQEDLQLLRFRKVPGATEAPDQGLQWAAALRHVGNGFTEEVLREKLPRFYLRPGKPGAYLPEYGALAVPSVTDHADQFQRAVYRYLAERGVGKRAIVAARDAVAYQAPLLRLIGGGYAVAGPWVDAEDGLFQRAPSDDLERIITSGRKVSMEDLPSRAGGYEFLLGVAGRCIEADTVGLATTWARCPQQVALYLALSRGNFVEGVEAAE